MPISIKNEQTEHLARQIAELTGESLTETIHAALAERYERIRQGQAGRSLAAELNALGIRCGNRPLISSLTADEILGSDELGAPTR